MKIPVGSRSSSLYGICTITMKFFTMSSYKSIWISLVFSALQAQAQFMNINGLAGSGEFGNSITVLPNGNYVVVDPYYSEGGFQHIGAVYLYNGSDHTIISILKGSSSEDQVGGNAPYVNDIIILSNSNFLVRSPKWDNGAVSDAGAITWCSGVTGTTRVVSSDNSLVGTSPGDFSQLAIDHLNSGRYYAVNLAWDNDTVTDAGAITFDIDVVGTTGPVNSNNSLVGTSTGDFSEFSLTTLSNGNFLLRFPKWDNGLVADAGAITWRNASGNISGSISGSNSLVGSSVNDFSTVSMSLLGNGNYVICLPAWDGGNGSDAGAVCWGNGSVGVTGIISSGNSLVGSSAGDSIGKEIVTIGNDYYVVTSPLWDNGSIIDAGAVTWCNGTAGMTGAINSTNSLIGSTVNDRVGIGGVVPLYNGNYVVISPLWDNGAVTDAGAATWANGIIGISGTVTSSNSLVGTITSNQIGSNGVTVLSNGNYVVISPLWDDGPSHNDFGAVILADGNTGTTGAINGSNSLVGSYQGDRIGSGGAVGLSNGNYVVISPDWSNGGHGSGTGAVTWGNGTIGITGSVNSGNSLVGRHAGDMYINTNTDKLPRLIALNNGNCVLRCPGWDNGTTIDAGAVTWVDGSIGQTGKIDSSNSLVGNKPYDMVGNEAIVSLDNGNYLLPCYSCDNGAITDAGAVTWMSGTTGKSGKIDSSNSLVGSSANDGAGHRLWLLPNGNYLVANPFWDNGTASDAGAVTWGSGAAGINGKINSGNSLVGTSAHDFLGAFDGSSPILVLANGNYLVISKNWNQGAGAVTWASGATGISGIVNSSNSLIGSNNDHVGFDGATALSDGNYVVNSPMWSNAAGALTWGNGSTGTTGRINSNNSLVGNTQFDRVGSSSNVMPAVNGNYIVYSTSWDNGAIVDAGAVTFGTANNGVSGVITSCNSFIGNGKSVMVTIYNDVYGYVIVGQPSNNMVTIYNPTLNPIMTMAKAIDTASTNISNNTTDLITSSGCHIIATLTPGGTAPVTGAVNAKVWIEDSIPTPDGYPFVARHYQITPVNNAMAATAKVILYFTQQDFDNFNNNPGSTLDLPTGEDDTGGKANLRIVKYPGVSNNGSGLPASYSGTPQIIDPDDEDIIWNSIFNWWEVSFDVAGFSGFVIQTYIPEPPTGLPLTLLEFKGRMVNNNALLNWITTDEINTSAFDIERSIDKLNYCTIGNVAAVNQPGIHHYSYTDSSIAPQTITIVYYRLKQTDINNHFTYSKIIALPIDNRKPIVKLYPIPVNKRATLIITASAPDRLQSRIFDNAGRVISQAQLRIGIGSTSLQIDASKLSKGIYYLELKGKEINQAIRFVKQ